MSTIVQGFHSDTFERSRYKSLYVGLKRDSQPLLRDEAFTERAGIGTRSKEPHGDITKSLHRKGAKAPNLGMGSPAAAAAASAVKRAPRVSGGPV